MSKEFDPKDGSFCPSCKKQHACHLPGVAVDVNGEPGIRCPGCKAVRVFDHNTKTFVIHESK